MPFVFASGPELYVGSVTFPAGFAVGDYVEFLRTSPSNAGASGNYEISISYTRGNIAAGATFLVNVTHSNPDIWREAGRISKAGYTTSAVENFVVDVNSQYGYVRFRLRAINTYGVPESPIGVDVKVRSINSTDSWAAMDVRGNSTAPLGLMPMTNEWNLFVGNPFTAASAAVAITATMDGNVGIGTRTPQSKLAVAGTLSAQKVKVTAIGWPDYVFDKNYHLPALQEVRTFIDEHGHLPEIPSAATIVKEGQDLGEMNKALLKKVEELTLYLMEENDNNKVLEKQVIELKNRQVSLEQKVQQLQEKQVIELKNRQVSLEQKVQQLQEKQVIELKNRQVSLEQKVQQLQEKQVIELKNRQVSLEQKVQQLQEKQVTELKNRQASLEKKVQQLLEKH
ncbi:hypothetical protein DF182_26280 [Chitinophaga flava]|uniref:Uncharacterized protein n=2 Tax=Chitinophaga flava TaxID=2259036 RepID=A0A365XWA0_9BACT|nr:hypothetical protein DF182_26280 [Chitinophaga flava]